MISNESKQTIFASGILELLQMVLKPDTKWYASENAGCHGHTCPRRVVHGRMPMKSQILYVFLCSSVLFLYF